MSKSVTWFRVLLPLVLLAGSATLRASDDPVRTAIEAANAAFIDSLLAGDASGVAEMYTPDARVMSPGGEVAVGRDAIRTAWQQTIDAGVKSVELTTDTVDHEGDLAAETGGLRLEMKDGTVAHARYVVVWKRIDGAWHLHRDIWNAGP